MKNPVIIFGAGTLGRAAQALFSQNGVAVYGFLDDDERLHGREIDHVAVLGSTDDDGYLKLIGKKCDAFVAVEETVVRRKIVKMLNERRKVMPANAFHTHISMAPSAVWGHGNFVDAGVTIGAGVQTGNHTIIRAGATVDAEAVLGDYVQVGAGSVISSQVRIEDEVFIGAGAVVVSGIHIKKGARIGAGSVVITDVDEGETVFGNPARSVKEALSSIKKS